MAERDHEFPWIETTGMFDDSEERLIRCTRCGRSEGLEEWIGFIGIHSQCRSEGETL